VSLKTRHIGAYRDLLVLFTKYGRKDFRLNLTPEELLFSEEAEAPPEPDVRQRAEAFAKALKGMGPTYVKFGQLLSTRPDIVPQEYIAALESLQDDLDPFSFGDVERIVEEELGAKISKIFETFEAVPVAAASLGQAHRAVLRDGREVVVKVQRPNVREQVRKDLEIFTEIAQELYISDTTVKTHITHILQKLELRDRVQAVVLAYQTGMFGPDALRSSTPETTYVD